MSLDHLITSLTQLQTFSHERCDAILQAKQIDVVNAYSPYNSGWERDRVYFGLYFIVGWLLFVLTGLVISWRRNESTLRPAHLVLPFFLLFGIGLLYIQLQAMAEYVDVCHQLLRSSSFVPAPSQFVHPIVAMLIVAAFAGAWYSIFLTRYREAKNADARFLPIVMMVIGGALLAYVIGILLMQLLR